MRMCWVCKGVGEEVESEAHQEIEKVLMPERQEPLCPNLELARGGRFGNHPRRLALGGLSHAV